MSQSFTAEHLHALFDKYETSGLDWTGPCHDCQDPVTVSVDLDPDGFIVTGGAAYWPNGEFKEDGDPNVFLKCDACHRADPVLRRYQKTEVYDRVVGYYRPVENMNKAKQDEQRARKRYNIDSI